ncbi:uncharacterized protein [Palaemon carinicauda]|uniref:uncharacterized protein n=1 Tax=Palaemon carinicauda TaxID=392227 RepID=UPI0035B579D2
MALRLITALFVLINTVSARDHHLSNGNLQQLEDGDYPKPHGNYRFPDIFPDEQTDDINGFYTEPQFDIEPPFYGRPEPFRVGRPYFRQPGVRRATRRPSFFSASTPSQAVVRTPPRGIVRGSGPFGRAAPTYVSEPGVTGFMKSFRRLIRTYI